MLHPDLHRYLDGEIPLDALPEELRREAEAWRAIEAILSGPEVRAPATLAPRVLQRVRETRPRAGFVRWLVAPRPLRPVAVLAAAAIAFFMAFPVARLITDAPRPVPSAVAPKAVFVQFVLHAPGATSVAVAGDFNEWSAEGFALTDEDGDGIWTGLFPISQGIHKYMFVVDGEEWVTDPFATGYVDDGFGGRNALLEVLPFNGRRI